MLRTFCPISIHKKNHELCKCYSQCLFIIIFRHGGCLMNTGSHVVFWEDLTVMGLKWLRYDANFSKEQRKESRALFVTCNVSRCTLVKGSFSPSQWGIYIQLDTFDGIIIAINRLYFLDTNISPVSKQCSILVLFFFLHSPFFKLDSDNDSRANKLVLEKVWLLHGNVSQ